MSDPRDAAGGSAASGPAANGAAAGAAADDVYFTWPDGRFHYQCQGCGDCCKGLGIGLDATGGELVALTVRYPGMVPFVRRRGATWTAFNPRGACWFLDDGLCRVERDHGRAAKPASCRLFPFNRVFRLGPFAIVDYNSVICPLSVAPRTGDAASDEAGAPGAVGAVAGVVSHRDVLAEIAAIADPGVVGTELPIPTDGAADPASAARAIIARERAIADACFTAADRAADRAAGASDLRALIAAGWQAQTTGKDVPPVALARVDQAMCTLTGQSWRAPDPATLAAALWLTPSLRFNELFGPRRWGSHRDRDAALADAWLAWLQLVALGAEVAARPLGLRELTSTCGELMPLVFAVARWTQAPIADWAGDRARHPGRLTAPEDTPRPDALFAEPGSDLARVAAACEDNRARRPLSALLAPLFEGRTPTERVALVRSLAPLYPHLRWRRARRSR